MTLRASLGTGEQAAGTRRIRAQRAPLRRLLLPYAFIVPSAALLVLFMYFPAASALYHSLFDWDGATRPRFIGLGNFGEILGDPVMQVAFVNVLKIALFNVVIAATVPLGVARLILSLRSRRVQYLFRVLFVIPLVIPQVVIILIWGFLYDPSAGPLNQLLQAIGLGGVQPQWLGDPSIALYALMLIGFPFVDGFGLLIYTAGFQAISGEVLQAAAVDGAGGLQRFWRIELPLIVGQIRLMMVLNMIWAIQNFVFVLLLTNGGPGNSTQVPGLALYWNAFQNGRMGYACAIGTILFLVMLGLTYINLRYLRSTADYDPAQS
jgi:raffinose/stachyose/melibiose transport system permease protein